jgi:transposase-like protein
MADRRGDKAKQPAECTVDQNNRCPNLKEVGGGMSGERYRCEVCGESYYLDYDEMR